MIKEINIDIYNKSGIINQERNLMYEWNPVFRFVMDIKRRYTEKFGEPEYKTYIAEEKEISSLEHWIIKLGDNAAAEKIKYLEVNQHNDLC
jgi:hypothetical protein